MAKPHLSPLFSSSSNFSLIPFLVHLSQILASSSRYSRSSRYLQPISDVSRYSFLPLFNFLFFKVVIYILDHLLSTVSFYKRLPSFAYTPFYYLPALRFLEARFVLDFFFQHQIIFRVQPWFSWLPFSLHLLLILRHLCDFLSILYVYHFQYFRTYYCYFSCHLIYFFRGFLALKQRGMLESKLHGLVFFLFFLHPRLHPPVFFDPISMFSPPI